MIDNQRDDDLEALEKPPSYRMKVNKNDGAMSNSIQELIDIAECEQSELDIRIKQ